MRLPLPAIAVLLAVAPGAPRGFLPESVEPQRRWEEKLRSLPDPARLREAMRVLSAEPHHLGSTYGEHNANWILSRFRESGLDARIETFEVLFPTPRERVVELLAPTRFRAALAEPTLPQDPTSAQTDRQLPTYNAYSIDGDVTAPLVYVNYGVPADYERLERLGVDVRGKIVIARYGASWRGIKPKVAAEKGAVGCLIYSDPREDGYFQGEVFPEGPFRPRSGVQRGSVMDMPIHPGDPLTPGVGATREARRLPIHEAKTLTRIPVLPISWGDAQPLLAALEGPVAPTEWRGALPITYRIGPGPARVRLKVAFDWKSVPVHNVIARIPGAVWPDEWVVHGNHHDAWVNGAEDPVSGMVALLEEARALGELVKAGWRPKRTIVLCAWDGEEQGLLGSTEWAETHEAELREKAVAYINTDSNGRGFLGMAGSHSLEALVNEVASAIEDPQKKISVLERARLKKIADAKTADDRRAIRERANLRIEAMGSGSDYTPSSSISGLPPSTSVSEVRTTAASTTRSTTTLPGTPASPTPISPTAAPSRRRPARCFYASAEPTSSRSISRDWPTPCRNTSRRSPISPGRSARGPRSAIDRSRRDSSGPWPTRRSPPSRRSRSPRCRTSTSRSSRTPRSRSPEPRQTTTRHSRRRLRERLRGSIPSASGRSTGSSSPPSGR